MTNNTEKFLLSDQDFINLKEIANLCAGINLTGNKKENLTVQIKKRLDYLDISDFDIYYRLLKTNEKEISYFINLITNVSTDFFREKHHFDYLSKQFIPELIKTKNKIRIWSAGCATGEELYSIAMVLYESGLDLEKYDIKILATDVNTNALEIAKDGIYDFVRVKNLRNHEIWFKTFDNQNIKVKVDDKLKKLITFRELNFIENWPIHQSFDIIFCRNVTIYLTKEVTQRVIKKFDELLELGGVLILGHSEILNDPENHYVCLGKSIYKKVD